MNNILYKCSFCERTFEAHSHLMYHQNRCVNNPNSKQYKKQQNSLIEKNKQRICEKCGKLYTLNDFNSTKFCSRSCANTRMPSEETKKKIANALKGREHKIKKRKN